MTASAGSTRSSALAAPGLRGLSLDDGFPPCAAFVDLNSYESPAKMGNPDGLLFMRIGTAAFAQRTRRELVTTGGTVRKRTVETRDDLTTQERQVALLARDGMSNIDIGARLFLSRHNVAYHLRKVFSKLEISSRRELATALPSSDSEPVPS
jgi:DNA-binding CsgD family transcriptional regulator